MEWIKCSERMPEEPGRYLTARKTNWLPEPWLMICSFTQNGKTICPYNLPKGPCFYNLDDEWDDQFMENITHWMPLPEPPTEKEERG